MTYDPGQFYNFALAALAGCLFGSLSFLLLPSLSPALRVRRLLALTLRDLRRLAMNPRPPSSEDWESRIYGRLAALPHQTEQLQLDQLLAALSAGTEIIQLRRVAPQLGVAARLDAALEALAQGNGATASARLRQLDHRLASAAGGAAEKTIALRARAHILGLSETLAGQRQMESLRAQRMSADANLTQTKAQLHQTQVNLDRRATQMRMFAFGTKRTSRGWSPIWHARSLAASGPSA
jgi:uncharacterized membrane protein YccC